MASQVSFRRLAQSIIISSGLLWLTACAGQPQSLVQLKHAKITSNPFTHTLAKGYLEYAEIRDDAYDFHSASHFADKGLLAAYDKPTEPENPEDWNIAPPQLLGLKITRTKLMALLNHSQVDKEPILAAEAQLAFDCWVDQQSGVDDKASLQRCQQAFFEHYAALKEALEKHQQAEADALAAVKQAELEAARAAEEARKAAEEAEKEEKTIPSTATIIYFPFDSAIPVKAARALIDELIQYILQVDPSEVIIHGHADRAGTERYNLELSERRADYVRDRLVDAGVKDERISHYGFGESDPKVPTEDGVREPANRRVEIFIQ